MDICVLKHRVKAQYVVKKHVKNVLKMRIQIKLHAEHVTIIIGLQ